MGSSSRRMRDKSRLSSVACRSDSATRCGFSIDWSARTTNWTPPDETRITSYAQLGRGPIDLKYAPLPPPGVSARSRPLSRFAYCPRVGPMVVHRNTRRHGRPRGACHLSDADRATGGAGAHPYESQRDLHDDIGANLSRIAMMSDVAQGDVVKGNARAARLLAAVASISREIGRRHERHRLGGRSYPRSNQGPRAADASVRERCPERS